MLPSERILSTFEHITVDRTPCFEYVLLSPNADIILGHTYSGDPDNWSDICQSLGFEKAVKQIAIDMLDIAQKLDHDMIYVCPNPAENINTDSSQSSASDFLSKDPVETLRRRNEKELEDIDNVPLDQFLIYELLQEEMWNRGVDLPIMAPAYRHGIWTDTDLMQALLIAPEIAREHFQIATKKALLWINEYHLRDVLIVGVGGDFAGNNLMISPQLYKKFIVPEIKRLTSKVHQNNMFAINASDGNLWPVIDDFLLACDVDGYIEIDFHAGMDLKTLKDKYGDKITFLGNIDCGNILSFGSPDEISAHVNNCIEAGWGQGGHVFCASNAITSSVSFENYLIMINTYRNVFGLSEIKIDY